MNFKDIQELIDNTISSNKDFDTLGELNIQYFSNSAFITPTALFTHHGTPVMRVQLLDDDSLRLCFCKVEIPYEIGYTGFVFKVDEPLDRLLSKEVLEEAPVAKLVYNNLTNAFEGKENNY